MESGSREGINQHGQEWKEAWEFNQETKYMKWSNETQQPKSLSQDGFESKWGQSREEKPGEVVTGWKWSEKYKEEDDYWEKKTERYSEYPRPIADEIEQALEIVIESPRLLRSGLSDFKNNRNYLYAEQWEEYTDGTILKKIVHDNGYGKKVMEEQGKKLNLEQLQGVQLITDQRGFFKGFRDEEGLEYTSLQQLMESNSQSLEWQYSHQTVDEISNNVIVQIKKGYDYLSNKEWYNKREINVKDQAERVSNKGKDGDSEWKEEWNK